MILLAEAILYVPRCGQCSLEGGQYGRRISPGCARQAPAHPIIWHPMCPKALGRQFVGFSKLFEESCVHSPRSCLSAAFTASADWDPGDGCHFDRIDLLTRRFRKKSIVSGGIAHWICKLMGARSQKETWSVLAAVNILVMICPVLLLIRASGPDENLIAVLALVACAFLLMVVDAITIAISSVNSSH